jgi:hypothetical protein
MDPAASSSSSQSQSQLFKDQEDHYCLLIYNVPVDASAKPPQSDNILKWIGKVGRLCTGSCDKYGAQPGLIFPRQTYVLPFFKALRKLLGVDIMALVGSSIEEAEELGADAVEDLCCGSMAPQMVNVVAVKISVILDDEGRRQEARDKARQFNLNEDWFLDALKKLQDMLDESSNLEDGITFGVLE